MSVLKILIVDDASFIRDLIKRSLRSQLPGMELDEASNGRKAQSLLQRNEYQLILCDWEMPESSGLEVLQALRLAEAEQNKPATPFVMVTSRGDKSHVTQAVEAGVSDYIGKPFTADQLLRKVIRQLAKRHKATLQEMMGRSERSVHEQASQVARKSAETLLGGTKQPESSASPVKQASAGLLGATKTAQPAVAKPRPGRLNQDVKADLRLSDATLHAQVEDINLTHAVLRIARSERLPQLFEHAALDIELGSAEQVARLNVFVYSLQASTADFDCDSLLVNVRMIDEDPEKYGDLSRFIARIR